MPDFDTNVAELNNNPYMMAFNEQRAFSANAAQQYTILAHGRHRQFTFSHTHYHCDNTNVISFRIGNSHFPGVRKVEDGALLAPRNAVYLPFFADQITSIRLDTVTYPNLRYFFTANLSGCAVYVDRRPGGQCFVYHANTQIHSGEREIRRQVPSWQHPEAVHRLDAMHTRAARSQLLHHTRAPFGSIHKAQYLAGADLLRKTGRKFGGETRILTKDWLGGTIVMGVRRPGHDWRFYFQCWGTLDRRGAAPVAVVRARQFC